MPRPRRDRRFKPVQHRSTTASPNRGAPDFMRRDWLGQKSQFVKSVPNNYLYVGAGTLALIGSALIASEMGWVDLSFFGISPMGGMVGTAASDKAMVRTGEPVKITGDIYKNNQPVKVPQIYLGVWEDNGDQMYNQMVAQNTSHFEATLETANYRDGTYSFAVDSKPFSGKPPELANVPVYTPLETSVSPGGAAFTNTPFGVTLT